ncbi:MAG TPA: electron transfer flavoprotein beta subunit/FixA family protein [Actinomycetaceae bacterium]|nr:electron transfer flavoprotein beta subunit/FixA family protein [Actinomycetaceae bacterium]
MTAVVAYKWTANPQDAKVGPDGVVDWSRAKASLSEYDPIAMQLAREVAEAAGTDLVGISVGSSGTGSSMAKKAALSRGLDRALLVLDDDAADWNLTKVAEALAKLVQRIEGADILFTGEGSIDENAKMTPALVAGFLGWPAFFGVASAEKTDAGWRITQNIPGGLRTIEVVGPVVVAAATDAAQPRIPGMKEILAAGKKPAEEVPVSELDLAEVPAEVTGRERPAKKARKQVVFEGEDAVSELVAALRSDGLI